MGLLEKVWVKLLQLKHVHQPLWNRQLLDFVETDHNFLKIILSELYAPRIF